MTTTTDNFDSDPSGNLTALAGSYSWDNTNGDVELNASGDNALIRYDTAPGEFEHEAQVTAISSASTTRNGGAGCRFHNSATDDGYICYNDSAKLVIHRIVGGTRTEILTGSANAVAAGDYYTVRLSAEGANGANVALSAWLTDHNSSTKPADPDWIGVIASPDETYTDTDATRLDDSSVHTYCGMGTRFAGAAYDSNCDWFKLQGISDRGGSSVAPLAGKHLIGMMNA